MASRIQPQDSTSLVHVQDYNEYIPYGRMDDLIIILSELLNTTLQHRKESEGVLIEEKLYGQADKLVMIDYDIRDLVKFIDLTKINYINKGELDELVLQEWVVGLSKSGVLNLLEIPFFGKIPYA